MPLLYRSRGQESTKFCGNPATYYNKAKAAVQAVSESVCAGGHAPTAQTIYQSGARIAASPALVGIGK